MKKRHNIRLIDYFLHFFHIGERCGCVIHWEEEVWRIKGLKSLFWPWEGTGCGCRQRSFMNGNNKTMDVYGDMVFLCNHCRKYHWKENKNYIEGHSKFLNKALSDPLYREEFCRIKNRIGHIK